MHLGPLLLLSQVVAILARVDVACRAGEGCVELRTEEGSDVARSYTPGSPIALDVAAFFPGQHVTGVKTT